MVSVKLQLPQEIVDDLAIPYEGIRDTQGIVLAVEGVNLVASVVTLASLQSKARELVQAIRAWRLGQRQPVVLRVKGESIDLKIDLPQNVSTGDLLDQLIPLLGDKAAEPRQK
jgi:hypothetical protein